MTQHGLHRDAVRLSEILEGCGGRVRLISGAADTVISSVEYNSSRAAAGSLFVAVEGFQSDGHRYVGDAVKRGASAVIVSAKRAGEFSGSVGNGVALLSTEDTRRALSRVSAAYYGFPASRIPVIGVTGTNGKTSITYMLESILAAAGYVPGVIGTVNYRWKGREIPAPNTTPESKDLQELAHVMAADGVDALIMEVSSHGLKLGRVDDIEFDAGIFTNLTRDHMDFHVTFEDYFESKRLLFSLMESGGKKRRAGIINIDDEYGARILDGRSAFSYPLKSFGYSADADYRPEPGSVSSTIEGIRYVLERPVRGASIELHVSGTFHVHNSLCAFAAAHAMGLPVEVILRGLSEMRTIPGRFERIRSGLGFSVIVDYAHTDDALTKLLQSARSLNPRRLITVFGCGGNRDRTKRPLMGRSAAVLSDRVIVTSDNPRNEEPGDIIKDILEGIEGSNFEVEADREKAIEKAVMAAGEGDIVVIAGKGHEDYQIIGKERRHFDDREMVRKFIGARDAK
jgi:UDP-N-acetylmuramoyl-L-alanyl-D-glutamate--2,6-diaminopimelate ligase